MDSGFLSGPMHSRLIIVGLFASALYAHEGRALQPHDVWEAWAWDPLIVGGLGFAAWLYARGARPERGMRGWEQRCYWAGWFALAIALLSPLHAMGEVLFSAHMAQHEVMMVLAAPLMILGRPL